MILKPRPFHSSYKITKIILIKKPALNCRNENDISPHICQLILWPCRNSQWPPTQHSVLLTIFVNCQRKSTTTVENCRLSRGNELIVTRKRGGWENWGGIFIIEVIEKLVTLKNYNIWDGKRVTWGSSWIPKESRNLRKFGLASMSAAITKLLPLSKNFLRSSYNWLLMSE